MDCSALPGKYMLRFTCNVCNTTSTKQFSKVTYSNIMPLLFYMPLNICWRTFLDVCPQNAYHTGVVIIRCPGCDKLHLVADRLGWYSDKSCSIEDIMAEKGQSVIKRLADAKLVDVEGQT
eukprot:GHVQ01032943.1.p1 GENE.GHVQ01032943.1~~GHVQ01032943.1.p1  ORF type:complete len:120 (-),score=7.61 GHVQ01032943.1:730-1089(-)